MSADNMTLLAFAATRRTAADMDRKTVSPAADAIDIACLRGPQQQCGGPMLGQTDGRTPYRYIVPAAYYATSVNNAWMDEVLEIKITFLPNSRRKVNGESAEMV